MYKGLHLEYRYSYHRLINHEFYEDIFEKLKYKISWKSVQREPSFFMRTDGQIDMTKLIVAFPNFTNAPKNNSEEFIDVM
jgi:hypothetical protein